MAHHHVSGNHLFLSPSQYDPFKFIFPPLMPGWTLIDIHPTQGRTFQRPLDALEVCFLWYGLFNGTEDSVHHYELSLCNGVQDAYLFSEANIVRAWLSTKRRYPLAGAAVRAADGAPFRVETATDGNPDTDIIGFMSEPHFVVRECDFAVLAPHEVEFGQVTSMEEAQRYAAAILHGPRSLSEEMLAKLYVFRETDAKRVDVVHLMIVLAHCVSDGTANRTFVRCLLDTIARGPDSNPPQVPLEERLMMVVPWVELQSESLRSLSPVIREWRRAVGIVILQLRMAKIQGGHTLPCRLTRSTWHVAARPGLVSTLLTFAQTTAVIANCRLHDITFGNAFIPLAQVAMTRVLYRRYLHGEISEEEWEYRKRQPHINGGPFNLRRYLDKAWYDKGGGGEFMTCVSLYTYQLPFMTLGATAERNQSVLSDGAPPFSDLLTFERFLHRAKLVKKQAKAFFSHPLLLEIEHAAHMAHVQYIRQRALWWMQHAETTNGHDTREDSDEVLAVTDIPMVWAHGGSSLGNLDLIAPGEYPLPPTHPLSPYSPTPHPTKTGYVIPPPVPLSNPKADATPTIMVENTRVHLYVPPTELYLGAATSRRQMDMYVHYNANVFEEGVVREWLNEVREAVLWYLGRTAQ